MQSLLNKSLVGSLAIASSLWAIALAPTSVNAASLINGWSYASDPNYDGSDSLGSGDASRFNFYGAGLKQVGDEVWFAVNSNLGIKGSDDGIGYGDLFFDFSPNSGYQANSFEYGVRFGINDNNPDGSKNGLYRNVSGQAVAASNFGYGSLEQYSNAVTGFAQKTARTGDLAIDDPYYRDFGSTIANPTFKSSVPNLISSGDLVDAIAFLSAPELDAQGFNKASMGFNGTNTYGLKFTKPKGFEGDFIASLFFECINDSIAIQGSVKGNVKPVPVPGLALGVIFAGICGAGQVWRSKRKQSKAV
jgi:hypothetical protein